MLVRCQKRITGKVSVWARGRTVRNAGHYKAAIGGIDGLGNFLLFYEKQQLSPCGIDLKSKACKHIITQPSRK